MCWRRGEIVYRRRITAEAALRLRNSAREGITCEGITLTLGAWGHTVSAHWLEPRARATFSRPLIQGRATYPRTLREVCDLSDEERLYKVVLRHETCQSVQED